ncbi:hypothetical protein JW964_12245, partial [candidate division KSB1 bacterium]|nr:hypothetical protein [candidate division KSB1 bacterium]
EKIYYTPPLVSEFSASEILKPPKKWWYVRKKILKRIELVFMPFYYFELVTESSKLGIQRVNMVVDGISGIFSLIDPLDLTLESSLHTPVFQFQINLQQAHQICLNEYKRVLLNYSLKRHVVIEIKEILIQEKLFYPFWVGYLIIGKKYDFQTIDAVGGKFQGVKMRMAFLSAFNQRKISSI